MTNPNDAVIAEFRANSGSVTQAMGGALAGLDLALLHHRGRHSGQAYITPVVYALLGGLSPARLPWRQAPARRP